MKARELLTINPLLYSDTDKYIWMGSSYEECGEAQKLFDYLLKKKIYIKGFVTNEKSKVSLKMYNKEIFDIAAIDKKQAAVFYDSYFGCMDIGASDKAYRARVPVSDMKEGNVVIWGSGITGERAYKILMDGGIRVKCFIDSDKKLEGGVKCGLPIYSPDILAELGKDIIIVEALKKWEEVDKNLQEEYEKRFYYTIESDCMSQAVVYDDGVMRKRLFCLNVFWMFNHFVGKKIYIYGTGVIEKEFVRYLWLMDFDFGGFLIDETDLAEGEDGGELIRYVEEILYEEGFYIWAYDRRKAKKLNELGLQYLEDYYVNDYNWDITRKRKNILDINLGHNYLSDSKYPGIMVYGEEKECDYKIAILGGSITDGALYSFKSWPQLLYEELGEENITIYNGGVCGYTSGQELIRLIRDILPLSPDMVIVYDGFTDFGGNAQYPFASAYLEKVFEYARTHMEDDEDDSYLDGKSIPVCKGIASQQDSFGNWLSNIRTMYAITSERNIRFFSFCSPVLSSKNGQNLQEKNMLLSMPSVGVSIEIKESFRKRMAQIGDPFGYIHDLSHIFDGEDDVYMDICHVWEKGNRIVAEEIKKIIAPVFLQ